MYIQKYFIDPVSLDRLLLSRSFPVQPRLASIAHLRITVSFEWLASLPSHKEGLYFKDPLFAEKSLFNIADWPDRIHRNRLRYVTDRVSPFYRAPPPCPGWLLRKLPFHFTFFPSTNFYESSCIARGSPRHRGSFEPADRASSAYNFGERLPPIRSALLCPCVL